MACAGKCGREYAPKLLRVEDQVVRVCSACLQRFLDADAQVPVPTRKDRPPSARMQDYRRDLTTLRPGVGAAPWFLPED